MKITSVLLALWMTASAASHALAASDSNAEATRKKPLQRCDQLKDAAQLDCLQKARESVIESRRKREKAPPAGKGRDAK